MVFHLARRLLTGRGIGTVDSDWGSDPSVSGPSVQASQPGRWDAESSITVRKHRDEPRVGLRGAGVDFRLFVVLFGVGRFCGGVVLPLLFYFNFGKC